VTRLGRVLTAMVTPFDGANNVDYEQAKKLALALLDSGSDGVVVSGTTGESPTLSKEEKVRLISEVKSVVGDRGVVVAGTGSNNTAESIKLTQEAEKAGADGALLVVPYYNKPTQDGLFQHFKTIVEGTSLPCILYNVPGRTVTNLAADTTIRLSTIGNIVGVKEASGNLEQIGRIIEGTDKDFLVYSGEDSDTLPIIALGGHGVISVVSHLVGRQLSEMIEKFYSGDTETAARIHRHLLPLMKILFIVSNPSPIKYAMSLAGFPVGAPRLPLVEPDEKSKAQIETVLKDYQIDLTGAH
jgi:4-hydroxy-tetrahydrodipicolinate synthase